MSVEYSGERFLPSSCKGEMAIEHYQRYQFARKMVKDKVVLDAACGEGYGSSVLAEGAEKVYGLDLDADVIQDANRKYGKENLNYITASVEELPFQDKMFDVVISFETIEHVNQEIQEKFLKEIKRVLKPDGMLIMSTPNKAIYTDLVKGENKFHVKEFYIQEFNDFLKKQFKNVECICQYPSVGYFITRENQQISICNPKIEIERCRYIMAICSDRLNCVNVEMDDTVYFDDSMYYFLNMRAHELEKIVIDMKTEADTFAMQLEMGISKQKEYIKKLEQDIVLQKEYIEKLEQDILQQEEYIGTINLVVNEQKDYIVHLEKDIKELKDYIKKAHR